MLVAVRISSAASMKAAAASWASSSRAERRVRDLEHTDRLTGGGTQQEVRVPLAAQWAHRGGQAEVVDGDLCRLLGGDRRYRQLGGFEKSNVVISSS